MERYMEETHRLDAPRGLGWLPDVPKPNDFHPLHPKVEPLLGKTTVAAHVAALKTAGARDTVSAPAAPPAKVDLRPSFSPIEDQGHLGSCTANAAAGLP